MKMHIRSFEWTFSSHGRERRCTNCRAMTSGFVALKSGVRKPLCSTCFFTVLKSIPSPAVNAPPIAARSEQLRLC